MGTDLNIGHATAYAYAKSKGYTGTEEQFATELAQFAQNAQKVAEDRAAVEQLVDEFLNTTAPAVIQDVTDEGTSQVERVADAGTAQVTRVGQAGDAQIDAVGAAGTTQIGLVTAEGTTQVTRVQDKGDEVIDSIPADYTALTQEVSDLNQQISYVEEDLSDIENETKPDIHFNWVHGGIDNATGQLNNNGSLTRSRDEAYYKISDLFSITNGSTSVLWIIFYTESGGTYTFASSTSVSAGSTYNFDSGEYVVRFDIRGSLSQAALVNGLRNPKIVKDVLHLNADNALKAYASFSGDGGIVTATPQNGKTWSRDGTKSSNQYRATLGPIEYNPLLKQIDIKSGYQFYVYGNNDGLGHTITEVDDWLTSYTFPRKTYKYYFIIARNSSNTSLSSDDLTNLFTEFFYDANDIVLYALSGEAVTPYEETITTSNYSSLLSDFNNAAYNRIYNVLGCADLIQNTPYAASQSKSGTLVTFNGLKSATNFTVQLYATKDDGGTALFVRYKINNIFYPWKNLTGGSNAYAEEMGYFVSTCINKAAITGIDSSTNILAFGDSIVSGVGVTNSWLDNVKNATGCTVVNKGVGGALFGESVKDSSYWISTQISSVTVEQWENSNLIIIGAGTNDAGSDTPLDELKTKVLSAITSIRENSDAPIMFITPIRRGASGTDGNLLKLPMISGIICNAAVANDCSVLNGFDIPIPTYTIGQISDLTQDHLHPNETGAKVYAQAVLNAVN